MSCGVELGFCKLATPVYLSASSAGFKVSSLGHTEKPKSCDPNPQSQTSVPNPWTPNPAPQSLSCET